MDVRSSSVGRVTAICLVFCLSLVVLQGPVQAQDIDSDLEQIEDRRTGIGAQLGVPAGLTLRLQRSPLLSYEFLAAFDMNDFFFLNASGLFSFGLNDAGWAYFIGPGAFVGFYDEEGAENVTMGLSVRGGISYYYGIFEFFGQVTPRFELINESDEAFGAGVGVRVYF